MIGDSVSYKISHTYDACNLDAKSNFYELLHVIYASLLLMK